MRSQDAFRAVHKNHTMSKYTKEEIAESIAYLREALKCQPEVYTLNRKVAASNMSACMSVVYASSCYSGNAGRDIPVIRDITFHVARACEYPLKDAAGYRCIKVTGCGMDRGFHLISTLSSVLGFHLSQSWI